MELYSWQKEALKAWQKNDYHGIVNVVTGAGKTVLALAGAAQLKASLPGPLRVKIVTPTIALAHQWVLAMRNILPDFGIYLLNPGYYHGSRKDNPKRDFMVYVVNSARYALARHILEDIRENCHVLLIADECHRYTSPENRKIFDFLSSGANFSPAYHSLGLSATPKVTGFDSFLAPSLGKEIYQYGFPQAVRAQTVCGFSIFQIALSFTPEELIRYDEITGKLSAMHTRLLALYPSLKTMESSSFFAALKGIVEKEGSGSDSCAESYLLLSYERKKISHMASARMFCVLDLLKQLEPDSRVLIFGERISQAVKVAQILSRQYPNQVGCYHSKMSSQAKKTVLSQYREGSLRILVSCRALDEGLDVPDANVGVVLSSSSVIRQRIQRLGRILRKKEGKGSACMYYLYVRESSEDSAYLADQEGAFPVCNLSYCLTDHSFSNPSYETVAAAVLNYAKNKGLSPELLKEVRRCLVAGLLLPDWLEEEEVCKEHIQTAKSQKEKNYWLCMMQMARERKK